MNLQRELKGLKPIQIDQLVVEAMGNEDNFPAVLFPF